MFSEQEFAFFQNQAKYLEKLYNPFNIPKGDLQNGQLRSSKGPFATMVKSKSFLGFESQAMHPFQKRNGSTMLAREMSQNSTT